MNIDEIIEKFGFEYDAERSFSNGEYEVEFYNLNGYCISKASFGDYKCYNKLGDEISINDLLNLLTI